VKSFSRIVLIIMAVAVLSSSFMAKPQAAYSVQETTSISDHQHDSDEPLNEHDPLLFHSTVACITSMPIIPTI
jgi:hypothetical protein